VTRGSAAEGTAEATEATAENASADTARNAPEDQGADPSRGRSAIRTPEGAGVSRAADDPVVDAWRGLLVAHSRLVPAVEADLRAAGQVPLSWYDVLLELNAAPDRRLRMSDLGQRAVLSRTRVSRVVDELAAAGLAERQPDEADGRSSFAVLTTQGRDALRRAWPVYRDAIRRHLTARLSAEQCRKLAALLGQVIAGAETAGPVRFR
jgi:DNA-binding MarR family transcriptional regulator